MSDLTKLTQAERDALPPYAPTQDGLYVLRDGTIVYLQNTNQNSVAPWKSHDGKIGKYYGLFMNSGESMYVSIGNANHIIGFYTPAPAKCEACGKKDLQLRIKEKIIEGLRIDFLCPDHRDKQRGKPCLACEIERLEAENNRLQAERDALPEPQWRLLNVGEKVQEGDEAFLPGVGWSNSVLAGVNVGKFHHIHRRRLPAPAKCECVNSDLEQWAMYNQAINTITKLEAENKRLQAEVERLTKPSEPEPKPQHPSIPDGWRLVINKSEKPHPRAMVGSISLGRWMSRASAPKKEYRKDPEVLYIVPIEPEPVTSWTLYVGKGGE